MFPLLQRLLRMDKREEVVFNWAYEEIAGIGRIFRPYIPVQLNTREAGWKSFDFIVDTGADFTMLPFYMADILGIKLKKSDEDKSTGIGGFEVKTWKIQIPVMIGKWQFVIPASITSENLTPLLLGRAGTLDTNFSWIFDLRKEDYFPEVNQARRFLIAQ